LQLQPQQQELYQRTPLQLKELVLKRMGLQKELFLFQQLPFPLLLRLLSLPARPLLLQL
jgi:hypothetical protein